MRPIVKSHRKGYVSNDGNGMVGGRWESATRLGYKDINVETLTKCISDVDTAEKFLSWLYERIGEDFRVEAYFDVGYDNSVGIGNYCEMDESLDTEQSVIDAIDYCPWLSYKEKHEIFGRLDEIKEDEEGYKLYEID